LTRGEGLSHNPVFTAMKVAILYNPRLQSHSPSLPDDAFEEYDSPETIAAIAAALGELGVEPVPVVADRRLPWRLEEGRFDFAFNIAEGEGRRCREAVPAAVCELLGLPYTGSDALTLAATLDKAVARRIVSPDVPVARGALVDGKGCEEHLEELRFPVIVKPNDEGSSKGIRRDALCFGRAAALDQCRRLQAAYNCPVLIEEFLPGREVTVGVRGNGAATSVLGLMEIEPTDESDRYFLYCVETKRDFRRRVRYHLPPRLARPELEALRNFALTAYRLLGCRDLARFDFRFDAEGRPHFMECNPLPGLNPESGDIVIMSRGVLPYKALVQGILLDAAHRLGLSIV